MPFTGYFDFLKQRRHDSKEERPKADDETDATILVSDLRLPVSSKVLTSESLRFRQWFQSNPGETEVQLQYVNVHCVWRTLQLMCRGEYTTDPCPKTQLPDEDGQLTQHASVYQLAEYWGLPGYLQNLAFENYKNIVQRGQWKTEDFLTSVNTILHPILPGDLSDVHEKENLKESRMVIFMLHHLHRYRGRFEGSLLVFCLQSSPVFLELFLNTWSKYPGKRKRSVQ
ncbi:hypothetical protein KXX63_004140 [Aspergillus fumigatus]|nr:hypothetical protein KXX63_004140 [Aspergillus fumigatus]KAH2828689.1 hypothetical protein KXW08_004380 [Aspergillus fumigatus]KAH2985738.1 hypothetical protein KXW58_008504 [Aspergillus fumigatus]KAH3148073.1 hypothetical protein KXV34_004921 [Aspergillus fumigatus]KAH3166661.1 hypothetical protein KXW49_004230 [Aspergillus fumigatus]